MGRTKLSNTEKFLNALLRGNSVSWSEAQKSFGLKSPRATVDDLRSDGYMVYINKSTSGTSYRIGTPTKEIIAAGINSVYGSVYA